VSTPYILVAIDIVEDQVVRLRQGRMQERTVYGHDPVDTALGWEKSGAEWLHVIDLDGATRGEQQNSLAIEQILQRVSIPVQVGGGIRTMDAIRRWLDRGATRVCIGTKATEPDFLEKAVQEFGDKLVAAVDSRQGVVQVGGWQTTSGEKTLEIVKMVEAKGVSNLMFTDIERDGTLEGPNLEMIEVILEEVQVPLIASGGVTTDHDVRDLAALGPRGLEGIIIGKALYSGALKLEDAKTAAASR
jgi:phosphoribosylformimino-5-aminoimidazole carboxamide ribotide isomerase